MLQKSKRFFSNKWFKRTAACLLLWTIIHIIYITADGCNDYKGNADVAIVLGNTVYPDGSLSYWLQGRVDEALLLYKQGKIKKIYASGGIGTAEKPSYPEGDAMKNYLVKHGVPPDDIIADNKGENTFLTARDFLAWNSIARCSSAVVVSSFYHITRSKYIIRKLGFANVYSASSKHYEWKDIEGTLREVPAYYKYVLAY